MVDSTSTKQPKGDEVGWQRLQVIAIVHISAAYENVMKGLKSTYKCVFLMGESAHTWLT
jgi:hypothetical protein